MPLWTSLLKLGMGFVRGVTNTSQPTAMQRLCCLIGYSYSVFFCPLYLKACHKTITLPFMSGLSQTISHLSVLCDFLVKKDKNKFTHNKIKASRDN